MRKLSIFIKFLKLTRYCLQKKKEIKNDPIHEATLNVTKIEKRIIPLSNFLGIEVTNFLPTFWNSETVPGSIGLEEEILSWILSPGGNSYVKRLTTYGYNNAWPVHR